MRIELNNKTHWRSDHIKAFIEYSMKDERPDLFKRGAPALRVRVVFTRGRHGGSSGHALIRGNSMTIRLNRENPDKVDFAFVITHELAHTRGMRHPAMRGNPHYRRVGRNREIYAWGNTPPLEMDPAKVKKAKTIWTRKPQTFVAAGKRPLVDWVVKHGFELVDFGGDEYEVSTKTGFNFGDGSHSRICFGVRDVRETVDSYSLTMEPCAVDCECREV